MLGAGRRPRCSWPKRYRAGSRRDRDGRRGRITGLGRIGRLERGVAHVVRPGRHTQPLRSRLGPRPRRRRRRPRRVRSTASSGASTSRRSTGGCSSTTSRSASTERSHSRRSTATRRWRRRSTSCRRCSVREESPPTSAGRVPMACITTLPTSSRCRTTDTACVLALALERVTGSTTASSASSPSKCRAPRPPWSSPRSSHCDAPTERVPSRPGRHPRSRSRPAS